MNGDYVDHFNRENRSSGEGLDAMADSWFFVRPGIFDT